MAEFVTLEETKKQVNQRPKIQKVQSYVLPLIIINAIVFVLQNIMPAINNYIILRPEFLSSQPWTLLTAFFAHSSFVHILFNMYALFLFGSILEQRIGPKRFIIFYIICGLVVNIISSFIYTGGLLGASGAIMGVIGMLIIFAPNIKFYLYFAIPMKLWQLGILYFVIDFFSAFVPNSTANIAHILGLFMGLGYGYYLMKKRKKFVKKFSQNVRLTKEEQKRF